MSVSREEEGEVSQSKLPREPHFERVFNTTRCDTAVPSAFGGSTADKFIPVLKPSYANTLSLNYLWTSAQCIKEQAPFLIYSKNMQKFTGVSNIYAAPNMCRLEGLSFPRVVLQK